MRYYSLSCKTVNTRENFWSVYCFATNQKRDETTEGNRQTATWISHDLIRNNEVAFSSMTNLQFYHFQILKLFFLYFTAVFNNMQTLKFKPPPTDAFFAAVNQISGDFRLLPTATGKARGFSETQTWFANMDLLCSGEWCFCM